MAEMCTMFGTVLAMGTTTTNMEIISMSGLEYSKRSLSKNSFSNPSGGGASVKCFAPHVDHTPLRVTTYFDPDVYNNVRTNILGTSTETAAITFPEASVWTIPGKVVRLSMAENTHEDRPTMVWEFEYDGGSYTVA